MPDETTGNAGVLSRPLRYQGDNPEFVGEHMELKKMEYDFTVCRVETMEDIDTATDFSSFVKRMKKSPWFASLMTHRKEQQSVMMDGKGSVFREFSIFP